MDNINSLQTTLERYNSLIKLNPTEPKNYIYRGMTYFKLAQIEPSIADFDYAEKLNPELTPFLWQRGLSYYYAGKYAQGAKQFELDLTVNSHDVEETVWRFLCIAQLHDFNQAQKSLLPVKNDSRLIMNKIYDLFAGDGTINDVLNLGNQQGIKGKFYSHLYVGLYHQAQKQIERSREFITQSVHYEIDDYMWYLARVHQQLQS